MKVLNKKRLITVSLLLVFIILSLTGLMSSVQQELILPAAEDYVAESQEKALAAFVTISVVKGLVAVVEGSDVVGIEVGDIVQPLYDSIDITWKLITACLATLYALEVVLRMCGYLGSVFLTVLLILIGVTQFYSNDLLKKLAYFVGVLAFAFYLAIPVSLCFSGKISSSYSEGIQDEFELRMGEFEDSFSSRLEEAKSAGLIQMEGWPPRVEGSFPSFSIEWPDIGSVSSPQYQVIAGIIVDMKELIDVLPEVLLRTGVTWLLDVIVIPLGMLFLLYKLLLIFIESFLGSFRAHKFEKAVSKVLEDQLKKKE